MVLVHGVLREGDVAVLDRLPGPARPVTAAGLAAVVSDAPARELDGDDAVAHLDLLVAAVRDVPVLPFAFGTALLDETAVRDDVLAPEAEVLIRRLDAVADVVELRLDLAFDTDASVAAIIGADPDVRHLAERARRPAAGLAERLAVGEATAVRVADHQEVLAADWTDDLVGVASRVALLHSDEQLRRTAYLVRRDRLADADAAVARLREQADGLADVEYVGPLPVFSFLDDLDDEPDHTGSAQSSRWGW